jgi:hypothetical protein
LKNSEYISKKKQRLTRDILFRWFLVTAAAIFLAWVVGRMICNSLSGFYPKAVIRTGVIENMGSHGDGEWQENQTTLFVRLDDGSTISVSIPVGIFFRIGEKVVVSERTTRLFHTKDYTLIRLLDKR